MIGMLQEHAELLRWLGLASLFFFFASLLFVPWLVQRIPADYFTDPRRHQPRPAHPLLRSLVLLGKNLLGAALLLLGALMLVLPGQGLLTIALGVLLLDFPGKYRLERQVVGHPRVLRTINWLRRRAGREPLRL